MLDLIKEDNVWNTLKNDNKPVIVYGMGNGAQKIMDTMAQYNIEVSGIFASDEFVRGHSFLGHRVYKYSEICQKYRDFNVVLAFATRMDNVIDNIIKINKTHKVFAPDVPIAGDGLFTKEYVLENEKDFDFVYDHLADKESKRIYCDIINFKISGKIDYLTGTFCEKEKIYKNILKLSDNETIVDLGAYDGDTIREFTQYTQGKYRKIYALEPDGKNFKKLSANTAHMENIKLYNMGAWDKEDTLIFSKKAGRNSKISAQGEFVKVTDIDTLIGDDVVSMIKMDIEGSELRALCGSEKIIKKYSPKLYICAYHRNEDLFALGKKIIQLNSHYKLYFRHSKYIPAWESNFYAICD